MTALLALASPELCAAALRQPPPDAPEDMVRVITAGSAAMGLDAMCGPWDHDAEVGTVRAELDGGGDEGSERLREADLVTGWLAASPGALPVIGIASGPIWLAAEADGDDEQEALDVASDFVAARVRSLCELGVGHMVVIEAPGAGQPVPPADDSADLHTPIVLLAKHFGVASTLVALDERVPAGALGYERWATATGGSEGLSLLTAAALRAGGSTGLAGLGSASVITDYLGPDIEPAVVKAVAADVAGRV